MMSLQTIRDLSAEAGALAAQEARIPKTFWDYEVNDAKDIADSGLIPQKLLRQIPNLGDYVPEGWEAVDEHFVDSSGLGADDEPALTIPQFVLQMKPDVGYAITSVGQFQIYITEFERR